MATYVYRCPECGRVVEESRSIQVGPHPAPLCGASQGWSHEYAQMQVVIQTSTLVFGNFEMGDDDFSRRYWNNGPNEFSKPNKTQGKTNVNSILRKYGPTGKPLELRDDIDSNNLTSKPLPAWSNGQPGGHVPAPDPLRSSSEILATADLK